MSVRKGMKPGTEPAREAEGEIEDAVDTHAPRRLTFAENVILTVKVLAGFGLLGAALWGINLWTAPR